MSTCRKNCKRGELSPDAEFVRKAASRDLFEVQLGELARKQGDSRDVQSIGEHMGTDRGKANDELRRVVTKKNSECPQCSPANGRRIMTSCRK